MFIALKPHDQRDVSADQVISRLQPQAREGSRHHPLHAGGAGHHRRRAGVEDPIPVHADRCRHERAQSLVGNLPRQAQTHSRITDVATDQENAGPRLNVTVNRDVASSFGILPSTIDNTLDDAFGQRIVSTIFTALNQYHVVLEVDPASSTSPEALKDIYLNSSAGQQVPLSTLVNSTITAAPIVINHQGMFPSTTISFNLKPAWPSATP